MSNNLVGTIRLSGEESINLVNALFRPSQEMIENRNRILDNIDSTIVIRRNRDGFEADIDDLDLSFLENNDSRKISMMTTVKLNTSKNFYLEEDIIDSTTVVVRDKEMYIEIFNNLCMNSAA